MDGYEKYVAGVLENSDHALGLAREIAQRHLPSYQPEITDNEMIDPYKSLGEAPFVIPEAETGRFSALNYAAQR